MVAPDSVDTYITDDLAELKSIISGVADGRPPITVIFAKEVNMTNQNFQGPFQGNAIGSNTGGFTLSQNWGSFQPSS
ncbi:MAG: hypothetical protein AB7G38_14555 [Dehalococcoidia bacterium]